jgi:predicted nucleotidyltransferase
MHNHNVEDFLLAFEQWARERVDIEGAGLVGSHARDAGTADSDVDLLILTTDPEPYFLNETWATAFGEIERSQVEDYGMVKSLRIHYVNGLEVEFGFSTREWASAPIDEGTLRVVSDGMRILYDPDGLLASVQLSSHEGQA